MPRAFTVAVLIGIGSVRLANAQSAECTSLPCASGQAITPTVAQMWAAAGQIHQIKLQFVAALREFTRAQTGTFGDESAALSSSLDGMRKALGRWDNAVVEFETALVNARRSAEIHVALATVYLDRHRARDALTELAAAARMDAKRVDVYTLQALAYGLVNDSAEAVRALRSAASLQASDPRIHYLLAHHLRTLERLDEARDAFRAFHEVAQRPPDGAGRASGAPFERVDLLRQLPGVAPIYPMALYADGFKALSAGDYKAAVRLLDRATERDPITRASKARQGVVKAGAALRAADLRTALELLEAAVRVTPPDAEAHRVLGFAYHIDGQHDRSIEQIETAIALNPKDERARLMLANALASAGRYPEAESALDETIHLFPASGGARYQLGRLHQARSRLHQAVDTLAGSEAFPPVVGRDHVHQLTGSIYLNQADFDRAAAAYSKRIDVNPNNAEAHRQLGEIYFLQGRDDDALAEFTAALFIDPRSARAHADSGHVHVRSRNYPAAVTSLRRALAVGLSGKPAAEARYALGTSLMRLGLVDEGKIEIETARRLQAEIGAAGQLEFELDALRREASQTLASGDFAAAIALLEQALGLEPTSARSHVDLGRALLQAGRLSDAVRAFEQARRLGATAEIHRDIAEALKRLNQLQESDRHQALADHVAEEGKRQRLQELAGVP